MKWIMGMVDLVWKQIYKEKSANGTELQVAFG